MTDPGGRVKGAAAGPRETGAGGLEDRARKAPGQTHPRGRPARAGGYSLKFWLQYWVHKSMPWALAGSQRLMAFSDARRW